MAGRFFHRASSIVLAAVVVAGVSIATAEPISPRRIRQNLFAACLAGDRSGWVVGELGRIFRTEDGGSTWKRQHAGVKKPLLAIGCLDDKTAWVGGKGGLVLHTTDAGTVWERLPALTSKHIFDIEFLSHTHGVAVGDWGLSMVTEDGGHHWTIVGIPSDFSLSAPAEDIGLEPEEIILYALAFADGLHGWTVGEFGTIMATTDGGHTWHQQHAPVDSTLFGVYFENVRRGWVVGIDAELLQTTDGGTTWRRIATPLRRRAFYDIAVRGRHGWIAGDAGTLLRSADAGRTWRVEALPIELAASWFRAVELDPTGRGLVVGGDGLLFRIENGAARDLRKKPLAPAARQGSP